MSYADTFSDAFGHRYDGRTIVLEDAKARAEKIASLDPDAVLSAGKNNFAIALSSIKSIELSRGSTLLRPTMLTINADKAYKFGLRNTNTWKSEIDETSFNHYAEVLKDSVGDKLVVTYDNRKEKTRSILLAAGFTVFIIGGTLASMFFGGAFTEAFKSPTLQCSTPSPQFLCSNPTYSQNTGNITLTVGQSTGMNWTGWGIAYSTQETAINASDGMPEANFAVITGDLASGEARSIELHILAPGTALDKGTIGTLSVCYAVLGAGIAGDVGRCTSIGVADSNQVGYAELAVFDFR